MNKQLIEMIEKMIREAREAADNAYCPNSGVPEGACLLTEEGITFRGCNVEAGKGSGFGAGEVAIMKAFSEGITNFTAISFFSERVMPFPTGAFLDLACELCPNIDIVVANEETFSVHKLHDLLPIRRLNTEGA
ncbi:MAG: cytidine deaminase [Firmicutes bacterium]|nr:cytidine deaminase [Bacillota bacterium]